MAGYGVSPHIAHGTGACAQMRQIRKPIAGQSQGDDEQNHDPELAHGGDQSIGPKQSQYPAAGTLTRCTLRDRQPVLWKKRYFTQLAAIRINTP